MNTDYMDSSNCGPNGKGRGVNMFPETPSGIAAAKAVCAGCIVVEACLAFALEFPSNQQHGVAGGLTADERRAIIKQQKQAAKS